MCIRDSLKSSGTLANPSTRRGARVVITSPLWSGHTHSHLFSRKVLMQQPSYVLVTAARNEAEHIEKTLTAVVSQTIRPQRWIIVSDGSTDDTDAIVKHYSQLHPWITLLHVNNGPEHSFRKQARSQNAGYEALKEFPFEAIGFLDGDTSVPPDLFEYLLAKLVEDPSLGVAGVPYVCLLYT